ERDEAATAKRYGADARSEPISADPGDQLARDIMECARIIKERTTEDLLGLSGEERLAIMKELENNK
ncbi:MAG: hypothetical protein ACHQ1F_07570, partial [Spirochaetia bacterium]